MHGFEPERGEERGLRVSHADLEPLERAEDHVAVEERGVLADPLRRRDGAEPFGRLEDEPEAEPREREPGLAFGLARVKASVDLAEERRADHPETIEEPRRQERCLRRDGRLDIGGRRHLGADIACIARGRSGLITEIGRSSGIRGDCR
ncbi:MAG: hypothetical protein H6719_20030 [Sandaracinaceae bacterium]|nr:hypothetical protein [Sandaracinaceae bacterium]